MLSKNLVIALFLSQASAQDQGSSCTADIVKAGQDLGSAVSKVMATTSSCSGGASEKCIEDVADVIKALGVASEDMEDAATDCAGVSTTCAHDISKAAEELSVVTDDVSSIVSDCGKSFSGSCMTDIISAGKDVGTTGTDISAAVKDCSSSLGLIGADKCSVDITAAGGDLANAAIQVIPAVDICQKGFSNECVADIAKVATALSVASTDVEKALTDCAGVSTGCAQAISKTANDLSKVTDDVSKAVSDCASNGWTDACSADITKAGGDLSATTIDVLTDISACASSGYVISEPNTDCEGYSAQGTCNADAACAWCTAGAVPPGCKDLDVAKSLPPAVFACDKLDEINMIFGEADLQ